MLRLKWILAIPLGPSIIFKSSIPPIVIVYQYLSVNFLKSKPSLVKFLFGTIGVPKMPFNLHEIELYELWNIKSGTRFTFFILKIILFEIKENNTNNMWNHFRGIELLMLVIARLHKLETYSSFFIVWALFYSIMNANGNNICKYNFNKIKRVFIFKDDTMSITY